MRIVNVTTSKSSVFVVRHHTNTFQHAHSHIYTQHIQTIPTRNKPHNAQICLACSKAPRFIRVRQPTQKRVLYRTVCKSRGGALYFPLIERKCAPSRQPPAAEMTIEVVYNEGFLISADTRRKWAYAPRTHTLR